MTNPPDFTFKAPGLLIEAWSFASDAELPFIGVTVEFDDSIARELRQLSLEAAMRYWQREIGSVRRGGRGDLAGWRIYVFKHGRVGRVRLSYLLEDEDDRPERDGQPDLPPGDEGPGGG